MSYPREKGAERHQMFFFPCIGSRQRLSGPCHTLIGIALDMGSSAFRCPECKSLYIIDPLEEGDSGSSPIDFSVTEIQGHRVELYRGRGDIAQRTLSDLYFARSFHRRKIGSLANAYIADTYSDPGAGPQVMGQMLGGDQGAPSTVASHGPPKGRKGLLAASSGRWVLVLAIALVCLAAAVAIYIALGS